MERADEVARRSPWYDVVDSMLDELRRGGARREAYWAQQLAFGPVLVNAVRLRYRHDAPDPEEARLLSSVVQLSIAALGALPEPPAGDPIALRLLASRQARAIGWGRRSALLRLLQRLGGTVDRMVTVVPARMVRAYPLLGFRPGDRLAG